MNDISVIDHFLDVFSRYIDSGFGLLHGEVAFLTATLIVIDMTLAGLFWAMGHATGQGEDVIAKLIRKVLYVGAFAYIIGNFNMLAGVLFRSFAGLGLTASGSTLSMGNFLQPGRLAKAGIDTAAPILDQIREMAGFPEVFIHIAPIVVLFLAWLVVIVSFFVLAVQLFVTLIEFKLTTLAGFVLVPFALWNKTAFMAEKVLGNVVSSGIKVLVLAVIVGIGSGLFAEFRIPPGSEPSIDQALVIMLASLSLLTACGSTSSSAGLPPREPPSGEHQLTAEDVNAWLDGKLPDALKNGDIPGAVVTVVKDGQVVTTRGYGWSDTGASGGNPVAVDPQKSLFRVASISKIPTSISAMQLVEQGKVDLDADISAYLDFEIERRFDEPLTLRHLLTHSAGFEEHGSLTPTTDLEAYVKNDPPAQVFAPGTTPGYANYGMALAGYIVQRVSGQPFETYVREHVLEPAGMTSSTYEQPLPKGMADLLGPGYTSTGEEDPFALMGDFPAGSLTVSAPDFAAFMNAQLSRSPKLLREETWEQMWSPGLGEERLGNRAKAGEMGLGYFELTRNGRRIVEHGGGPSAGGGWVPKLPKPRKPKGPERPPERVGLGVPPNMRSRSSRSGSPAEPPVSKRTLPPWPPNMEERMSSKPAPPAPPGPPAWKRAPPPAIERIASYCLRSASSDRTA